jgi:cytochrome c553
MLFREGIRHVPAMQDAAKPLSDADIADLAAHFARLPPRSTPGPRKAETYGRGAALARRLLCGTCHLPNYAGREQMPRLAHQREDYLLHSMREYRDNRRAGTDTSMNGVLYGLSDEDLAALAHFLAQQR